MNIYELFIKGPVSFELDSKNITARRGYSVTIKCEVLGDHPIRINWKINGRSLESVLNRYNL